jgi:hypothetical protein
MSAPRRQSEAALLLALGTVLYHSSQHSLEEGLREASEGQQRRW